MLFEWCIGNDVILNPDKCKTINFSWSRVVLFGDVCSVFKDVLHFVDNLKLYKSTSSMHDVYLLQSNLDVLFEWCIGNDVILNPDKCKTITFSCSRVASFSVRTVNDVVLERVDLINDNDITVSQFQL